MAKIDLKSKPVEHQGETVNELEMREPTVADQLSVEHIPTAGAREVQLFANLCGVDPDLIKKLTLKQHGLLQDAYSGFM